MLVCLCVDECWRGVCVCVRASRGSRGSSSPHQMKLSAGTLLSQTGTHLPMASCKVLGEGRNKGAKRLCDNEGALRRAFKSGTQAAWDKLCQSRRNYFLCNSEALCGHSTRAQGRKQPQKVHSSLCFASHTELTRSLWDKFTAHQRLIC